MEKVQTENKVQTKAVTVHSFPEGTTLYQQMERQGCGEGMVQTGRGNAEGGFGGGRTTGRGTTNKNQGGAGGGDDQGGALSRRVWMETLDCSTVARKFTAKPWRSPTQVEPTDQRCPPTPESKVGGAQAQESGQQDEA